MPLPVPSRQLEAGSLLQPTDFELKEYRVNAIVRQRFLTSANAVLGRKARVALAMGKPVPLRALEVAYLVRKGVATPAAFEQDGIEIIGSLVPLVDANAGDSIQARNPSSGLNVQAIVQDDGSLQVGP